MKQMLNMRQQLSNQFKILLFN